MNKVMAVLAQLLSGLLITLFLIGCEQTPTVQVKTESLDITISASGELESKQRVYLSPPTVKRLWQYTIKSMLPENSLVEKGQIVLSFDNKKVMERLKEKQGQLAQAQKELENKTRQEAASEQELILAVAEKKMAFEKAERKTSIVDHNSSTVKRSKAKIDFKISTNDLTLANKSLQFHQDNTQLNIKRIQAKVDRLSSEVTELKSDLNRLKVKAPISGMVIYKPNWNGEKSSVGARVNQGQSVIEIAVIDDMQVKAQVTEPDSGKVKLGQSVQISLDTAKDKVFNGTITALGKVFREKSWQDKSKVFDVIISIEKVDTKLMRPGMSARISVANETITEALIIPLSAIKWQGNEIVVQRVTTLGSEQTAIEVSHVIKNKVVVSQGLQAGDEILL